MKELSAKTAIILILILLMSTMTVSAAADEPSKLVALTFDDGPGPYTQQLLDGLRERGAHVTFFMLGQNASYYPETVRRAWEDGHQICSHTYGHKSLKALSDADILNELALADAALDTAIGHDLDYWLRPPYGDYTEEVLGLVGVPCFLWTVDTRDWESRNADAACAEFINSVRDGSIVLMHDIYDTSVTAALRAIDALSEYGYEFVTVSELFARRGMEAAPGAINFSVYPGENGTESALSNPVIEVERTPEGKKIILRGDERAALYYTTDGNIPEPENCKLYEEPFYINESTVISAVCVRSWNGGRSSVVSENIKYFPLRASILMPHVDDQSIDVPEESDARTVSLVPVLNVAAIGAAIVLIVFLTSSRKHF